MIDLGVDSQVVQERFTFRKRKSYEDYQHIRMNSVEFFSHQVILCGVFYINLGYYILCHDKNSR